ncbi:GNAT family N-acetyltransferase [Estrella lausannensis]|uniref:GNAT family N-acetyltransferase n=1 Tax=Estrella lausannensis TaxID=483423 RepID=UPI000BF24852|nr:GNAT family N-acetyltransferase [Estrella lausannensis]
MFPYPRSILKQKNRGIGRNLMMNVLRQIPDCRKIALSTRVSNKKAISAYQHWGFTPVAGTMESWANLEYIVE